MLVEAVAVALTPTRCAPKVSHFINVMPAKPVFIDIYCKHRTKEGVTSDRCNNTSRLTADADTFAHASCETPDVTPCRTLRPPRVERMHDVLLHTHVHVHMCVYLTAQKLTLSPRGPRGKSVQSANVWGTGDFRSWFQWGVRVGFSVGATTCLE